MSPYSFRSKQGVKKRARTVIPTYNKLTIALSSRVVLIIFLQFHQMGFLFNLQSEFTIPNFNLLAPSR
jgi:hypothetical protein